MCRRRWPGAGLGGGQIGRCRGLPAEHAVAFAMGTHGRLGGGGQTGGAGAGGARRSSRLQGKAASPIFRLKEELVGMIVGLSGAWPAGRAGREEGVVRLLGGVAARTRNEPPPPPSKPRGQPLGQSSALA